MARKKKFVNPEYEESEVDKMAREERERQRGVYNKQKAMMRGKWFFIAFLVMMLDQITKWAATELYLKPRLGMGNGMNFFDWLINLPPIIPSGSGFKITSFLNIVMVWNTGVSFGFLSNFGPYMPYILIGVACFIIGLFLFWMLQTHDQIQGICCALIIGGAFGNIIDRLRFGAVIDFIDMHALGLHWPAYNIADAMIVIGVGMLIITSFAFDRKTKQRYRKKRQIRRERRGR